MPFVASDMTKEEQAFRDAMLKVMAEYLPDSPSSYRLFMNPARIMRSVAIMGSVLGTFIANAEIAMSAWDIPEDDPTWDALGEALENNASLAHEAVLEQARQRLAEEEGDAPVEG